MHGLNPADRLEQLARNLGNGLLQLLYPRFCPGCKEVLSQSNRWICLDCELELAETNHITLAWHRWHKGNKDNHSLDYCNELERRFWTRVDWEGVWAQWIFRNPGVVRNVLHQIKYGSDPQLAFQVGQFWGSKLQSLDQLQDLDGIVAVPVSEKKRLKRGYNQAEKIAEGIAESLSRPYWPGVLERPRDKASQTVKDRFARWEALRDEFSLARVEFIEGKHVLLVDDVVTTGATAETCARLLKPYSSKLSLTALAVAA
jgi:ComF family protein